MSATELKYLTKPSLDFEIERSILNRAYQIEFYSKAMREGPTAYQSTKDYMLNVYSNQKSLDEMSKDPVISSYFSDLENRGLLKKDDDGFYNTGFGVSSPAALVEVFTKLVSDHKSR